MLDGIEFKYLFTSSMQFESAQKEREKKTNNPPLNATVPRCHMHKISNVPRVPTNGSVIHVNGNRSNVKFIFLFFVIQKICVRKAGNERKCRQANNVQWNWPVGGPRLLPMANHNNKPNNIAHF